MSHYSEPLRQSLANRAFTFLGLMILCGGAILTVMAVRFLWSESWSENPSDAERSAPVAIVRLLLLTGIACLGSGAFIVSKRPLIGGLLLLVAVGVYLSIAGDR